MNNKCLKKSTMQQLKTLVEYMEQNPEIARGTPVFGSTKLSLEEKWKSLCENLNAVGPPSRTIAEWKKTWADLKSRTKKKIAENKKSLQQTGGGLYQYNCLTPLEQVIDRTLFLSSAAAPSGVVFGGAIESDAPQSIDDCFQLLVETPPQVVKSVAVITPTRKKIEETVCHPQPVCQPEGLQKNPRKRSYQSDSDVEKPTCSSAKKRKTTVEEQLSLIRRQLRVAEKNSAIALEQADATKRLANAAEVQAEASKRRADAAEAQVVCMKAIMESTQRIEKKLEELMNLKK